MDLKNGLKNMEEQVMIMAIAFNKLMTEDILLQVIVNHMALK